MQYSLDVSFEFARRLSAASHSAFSSCSTCCMGVCPDGATADFVAAAANSSDV